MKSRTSTGTHQQPVTFTYRPRRATASNSSLYASVNMPMVNAQFSPLGLGNTHTADPPNVVGCNPHARSRRFRNTEHAGFPRNARYLGLYFAILRSNTGRAAM